MSCRHYHYCRYQRKLQKLRTRKLQSLPITARVRLLSSSSKDVTRLHAGVYTLHAQAAAKNCMTPLQKLQYLKNGVTVLYDGVTILYEIFSDY